MRTLSILIVGLLTGANANANNPILEAKLKEIVSRSDGRIGICVGEATEADPTCINANQRFSLQSVMKLIVAAGVLYSVDRGKIKLSDPIVVKSEDGSPGPKDFLDLIRTKGSLTVSIDDLIHRAVNDSDSTSIDVLIDRTGGIKSTQSLLLDKGIEGIRIDRDERHIQAETMGLKWQSEFADYSKFEIAVNGVPENQRQKAWTAYLNDPRDTATPLGMFTFLTMLANKKLLSESSSDYLLGVMSKTTTGKKRLKAGLPLDWRIGHKTGTSPTWKGMAAATNDVGILVSPKGRTFAVAVFVAESTLNNDERESIIAKVSEALVRSQESVPGMNGRK